MYHYIHIPTKEESLAYGTNNREKHKLDFIKLKILLNVTRKWNDF